MSDSFKPVSVSFPGSANPPDELAQEREQHRLAYERSLRDHLPGCPARGLTGRICRCAIMRGEVKAKV